MGTSRGGRSLRLSVFEREGLPGGQTVPYQLFVRGGRLTKAAIAGMGTPRTIVLPDGSSRGILDPIAPKGKETTG